MKIISFNSLPKETKRLILYYSIAEIEVVGMVIFNAYLFLLGYSVFYVGSIISLASFLTTLLLPLLGYISDKKLNAKYFLMTSEALIGISFLIYGLAINEWWIFIGRVLFSTAMIFSFALNIYEKEVYPKERLEDVYIWHWILPSLSGIFVYLGAFIYFSFFPNQYAMRAYYIIFSLMTPAFMTYIYLALPNMPVYKEKIKIKIPRQLYMVVLVAISSNVATYFTYGIAVDNIIINHYGAGVALILLLSLLESIFAFLSGFTKANISKKYFSKIPFVAMGGMGFITLTLFFIHRLHVDNIIVFLSFYSLMAILWPLWHMSFKPILLTAIPKEYRGTIFSSIAALFRFINIPMAFIIGTIATTLGSFSPLLLAGIASIITIIILSKIKK